MKFTRTWLVACLFLLVACSPSAEDIAKQMVKEYANQTATAVARAPSTATPSSTFTATFTPPATSTSTPTVTPTRTSTPIPTAEPITKGNVLFQDDLRARSGNNWSNTTRQEDFYFQEGKYHVVLLTRESGVNIGSQLFSYPRQYPRFQDFILEAEVTQWEGDDTAAVGVTFRQLQEALYAFEVAPNGRFRVRKNTNISTDLIKWTPHSAILGRKQPNVLRVIAKGNSFTFYINGTKVGSVTDSSFTSGTVSVQVSNLDSGGVIHGVFANLNIWNLGTSSGAEEFTKGNILFQDKLAANIPGWTEASTEGWSQGKVSFNYFYQDNKYHASVLKPSWRAWGSPARQPALKDFVLEVQMTALEGTESDTGPFVLFRNANREFYVLQLRGAGTFGVAKSTKGVDTVLIPRTSHPVIQKQGQPNKVMIVAKGTSFSIFINDTKVGAFTDTDLPEGGIALGVSSDLKGLSHSTFENITIWELK